MVLISLFIIALVFSSIAIPSILLKKLLQAVIFLYELFQYALTVPLVGSNVPSVKRSGINSFSEPRPAIKSR